LEADGLDRFDIVGTRPNESLVGVFVNLAGRDVDDAELSAGEPDDGDVGDPAGSA
jgi:hypothetical protein